MRPPGRWDPQRIHALTAGIPGLAFLLIHVVQVRDAESGRAAYVDQVLGLDGDLTWTLVEAVFFVAPLAVHAGLGIGLARTTPLEPPGGAFRSTTEHRWQRVTGIVASIFLLIHVGHTWARRLAGASGASVFDELARTLGHPAFIAIYAIGLGAVAVHVAVGLPAVVVRLGGARGEPGRRTLRAAGVVLGFVLWALALDATASFATGAGLPLPWDPPAAGAPGPEVP